MLPREDVGAVDLQQSIARHRSKEAVYDTTGSKGSARHLPTSELLGVVWTMQTLRYLLIILQVMLLHATYGLAQARLDSGTRKYSNGKILEMHMQAVDTSAH